MALLTQMQLRARFREETGRPLSHQTLMQAQAQERLAQIAMLG